MLMSSRCFAKLDASNVHRVAYTCHGSHIQAVANTPDRRQNICCIALLPSVQAILLDSFYGTERGFSVSSEARAEISELITQLEAKTPNPAATEAGHTFLAQSMQL